MYQHAAVRKGSWAPADPSRPENGPPGPGPPPPRSAQPGEPRLWKGHNIEVQSEAVNTCYNVTRSHTNIETLPKTTDLTKF